MIIFPLWVLSLAGGLRAEESTSLNENAVNQPAFPTVKLPNAVYQASRYDKANDIYIFTNIRYAAPPVGPLRFAKPIPPAFNRTVQNGQYGNICHFTASAEIVRLALSGNIAEVPRQPSIWDGLIWFTPSWVTMLYSMALVSWAFISQDPTTPAVLSDAISSPLGEATIPASEDCLFLDVVVPGKALRGEEKLPVVNWIHGGAYIIGSKDSMAPGIAGVKQAQGNMIFVAGNYRLGAFGFLGGRSVEMEGTPNAGLWDQRAVMQWIQQNIHLFGGDPNEVTIWGESTGAGSIMHHLVAFGGKEKPLFKRAILQSPTYASQIDRNGSVEQQYQDFLTATGCKGWGIGCLRWKDEKTLKRANDYIANRASPGGWGFGPVPDGTLIRQLPALELASGNYNKGIQSLILTHVQDEGSIFATEVNNTAFEKMIRETYGKNENITSLILEKYPRVEPDGSTRWKNGKERMAMWMTQSVFNCQARAVANAYKDRMWIAQYSRGSGKHGDDMLVNQYDGGYVLTDRTFGEFAVAFRSYLLSFARTGDPNKLRSDATIWWPKPRTGDAIDMVLEAGNRGFLLMTDHILEQEDCAFWIDVWSESTKQGGYTPVNGTIPPQRKPPEMDPENGLLGAVR